MIRKAVILAAGLGSRLGTLKEEKPKAFVRIGGTTLIERSLQLLFENGIESVLIGTGYKKEYFDELKRNFPQVETICNDQYESTGSMYTLYNLKGHIDEDILLLEGDLLYERRALDCLLGDGIKNIILASSATYSGDEVYIEANDYGFLERMSKNKSDLERVSGELVGISKLSRETVISMCGFAQKSYQTNIMGMHYEDALVGISDQIDLTIKVEQDLAWCEIDDASHLNRAIEIVYPKIVERG